MTWGRLLSRGSTKHIVARPSASPTTSCTWRRMRPRRWLMRHVWAWGRGGGCADVVESLDAILERAYNDHTAGGGGMPGATSVEREAEVVLQVWEWWFVKFDLPLGTLGTPHVAPCTMAKLMCNHGPLPMSLSFAPLALVSPIHGPRRNGGVD